MPTLTKKSLTEHLNTELGLNKREALGVVEAFFDEVSNTLATGTQIKLTGLGNFNLRDKGSRPGRNPKSGKFALIKGRRVVTFKASPKLKAKLEQYAGPELAKEDE